MRTSDTHHLGAQAKMVLISEEFLANALTLIICLHFILEVKVKLRAKRGCFVSTRRKRCFGSSSNWVWKKFNMSKSCRNFKQVDHEVRSFYFSKDVLE